MNVMEGVNAQEENNNKLEVKVRAEDDLHDNEKGRPTAIEERIMNDGIGASLRFETADTNFKYGDLDELHLHIDFEGDGKKIRFLEFNMDKAINDSIFKVGMVLQIGMNLKMHTRLMG
ncbi:hypothetical protein GH714_008492 [Hevea brasiliensis]|uniref:Uncharacterized protein n=1 Tax=Hevea brasiliensis TaxID=3981 RepID=A0A6A6MCZ8_HEVBR|nr:hypothetical protein GH714_008492 [Hevea brasiliensis]